MQKRTEMKRSDSMLMQYKQEILSKISLVMFLLVIPMGFFRIYESNYLQATSDMVLGSFLLYTSFKAREMEGEAFFSLARKVFLLAFLSLFILMIHTQETLTLFIWFTTLIYLVFYIFDNTEGWRWFIGATLITVGLFLYNPGILGLRGYELLVLVFNIVSVLFIITWYEKIKMESAERLLEQQHLLEEKVKEKTEALRMLNENLEQRVHEEVMENREKEKQLIQQSRLAQMGEIINMIAHQWRQPLSAISTSSAILEIKTRQEELDRETILKKVQDISLLSQKLSQTIDDFRSFFQPDSAKRQTSYDEIVHSAESIVAATLQSKGIKWIQLLECHDPLVTYAGKVKQVVLNLVKNAEDALVEQQRDTPWIQVRTYRSGAAYILEVSDNAGGIPETMIGRIFDPYFSTKDEKNGTGLGLYMSKVIIEKHCGGKLEVENGNTGACFRIVLYEA